MDEERFWKSVLARDARWDGRFVYAVRSTGVYCRPSCPSRRPGRGQVVFFALPEIAESAGFRACLRCRPRAAPYAPGLEGVREAVRLIASRPGESPTLAELSVHVGASPYHLQRAFKRATGVTPRQYADACRLEKFKDMLREGRPISDAIYEAGYGSSSRIYERAQAQIGMTPARYRRGGKGAVIAYAVARCPLGRLLVAATPRGVCAVKLGDSAARLVADLRREFPEATLSRDDGGLKDPLEETLRRIDGEEPNRDLPLDVRATAFQRRVWEHLRTIPRGRTSTYAEVSRALGLKNGARAVGGACAANPVALLIPCHRVVRADGGLGGYRWGLERKRRLLDRERKPPGKRKRA